MSLAEWQEYRALDRQVRDLEKEERRAWASVQNRDQYHYLMTPTCPPSTTINIRGGNWGDFGYGYGDFTPATSFDLTDYDSTRQNGIFENAYWYTFYWMSIDVNGTRLYIGGSTTGWWNEYETATEAEIASMAPNCDQLHNWPPWDYGIPIGCLILRNNGTTGLPNEFQAIDAVNRGRSYIWKTHESIAPRNVM